MKKIALFGAALTAFAALGQAQPYSTWTHYRNVTVNTSSTGGGANIASTVSNFPVLVRLTNASSATGADVLSAAKAGGADIRFSDATGMTALAYEIESWTATQAAIWVRVPSLPGSASTSIRMFWGKADSNSISSGPAVFGTNNFLGVWHMGTASGAAVRANSVNPGTNDATPGGPDVAGLLPVPGNIGMADSLRAQGNASLGDHFAMGSITYPNQQITMGLWAFMPSNQVAQTWTHFMGIGNTSTTHALWFGRVDATNNRRARGAGGAGAGSAGETDVPEQTTVTDGLLPQDQWSQFVVSRDSTEGRRWNMYKNGTKVLSYYRGEGTTSSTFARHTFAATARSTHWIGRSVGWGDRTSHIVADEVRISAIARSDDWVKLEYETQKQGATAVTLGNSLPNSPRPLVYSTKNASYILNQAISANTPIIDTTTSGANPFAIDSTLPAGLSFNTTTGVISGTPTALSAQRTFIVTVNLADTIGRDTLMIAVTLGNPPGAPTSASAIAGSASATVTWSAPGNPGSSAITSYVVRAVEDTSKTCTWTTGTLSCNVTGLTNGTSYTFTVRAANVAGFGPASSASAAVIPAGVPTQPQNVVATQAGTAASATVSWTAPASNGGQVITDYYVTSAPGGFQCYSPPISNPTCTVTGLTYNTAYTFTVVAANSVGNSAASAPSNTVTPVGLLTGPFAIQVSGAAKPFVFTLTSEGINSTEALTMTISDIYGRTVWSKTVNPKADKIRELRWNAKTNTGRAVSAGTYLVRVTASRGGQTSDFIRKAVSDR
jgi:hypothetical protein